MTLDLAEFRRGFFEEARENAAIMEQGLLALEADIANSEVLNGVFRAAHSIKGAAGTLGFPEVAEFTHLVETVLDAMRQGSMDVVPLRITILLHATDDIRKLIAASESGTTHRADETGLRRQLDSTSVATNTQHGESVESTIVGSKREVQLTIAPTKGLFVTGLDPILVFRDLAKLGKLTDVNCDLSRVPRLAELDGEQCLVSWTASLHTDASEAAIRDVFLFVEQDCEVDIVVPAIVHDVTQVEQQHVQRQVAPALARQAVPESTTLRVTSDKVDSIIDLVGELVIAQSMVMQLLNASSLAKTPTLRDAISSMTRNMQELQERVMGIRMVPMSTLFGRFSRIVRDTAAELGKSVQLVFEGQDTEIDKAVVERLIDPITHLVRNALDHGLETDEERARLGKSEPATLRLAARHVAGGVVIEVSENGRGLDTQRIRQKAEQLGFVSPGDALADNQVHSLIFEPGFSTAAVVSNLSGRGVGMDVVRRCVDALNGKITISTCRGVGTAFEIRLPLTLAILDGLLFRVDSQVYVLPLLAVVESFRPSPSAIKRVAGGSMVAILRDIALPLIDLGYVFCQSTTARSPDKALVVVVEVDGKRLGLVVDSLIGQSQVVVKSVETHYRRVDGVLGATILGDGRVAFILDVGGIARLACSRQQTTEAGRAA